MVWASACFNVSSSLRDVGDPYVWRVKEAVAHALEWNCLWQAEIRAMSVQMFQSLSDSGGAIQ